jgi:hypothetical protein
MAKAVSEYSRTNSQEEEEKCIVATIQFRKLSKRQQWIILQLKKYGCLDFKEVCDWCCYLEAKASPADGPFGAESVDQKRKRFLIYFANGQHIWISESEKQSIYRSMRELEGRDLIARLEHQKPTVWTWIEWKGRRGKLGLACETPAFNPDSKQWGKDTWRSAHYRWGKPMPLSTKELKRNVKYYDKLWSRVLSKSSSYRLEAKKRGLLVDDTWIDE